MQAKARMASARAAGSLLSAEEEHRRGECRRWRSACGAELKRTEHEVHALHKAVHVENLPAASPLSSAPRIAERSSRLEGRVPAPAAAGIAPSPDGALGQYRGSHGRRGRCCYLEHAEPQQVVSLLERVAEL
eukprot:3498679-Rhodomonas_salina.2